LKKLIVVSAAILLAGASDCPAQYFLPLPPDVDSLQAVSEPLAYPAAEIPMEPDPFWISTETNANSTGMIWRDCNLDGYIDLFIANGNDILKVPNYIYISNGGELPQTATWSSSNNEYSGHCAVGDIDDNGWPDFLVCNFVGETTHPWKEDLSELYLNYSGLPLTVSEWQTEDSMFTFSCALGDPDGDGDLDAAFATGTAYMDAFTSDRIYFNDGGTLQKPPGWLSTPQTAAMDVTWGDVDNDGDLDLAFCYDLDGAAVYYNHDGVIETLPSWRSDEQQSANTLIFGDVNNDGWLDLVVAFNHQLSGYGYFMVYYNDGTGVLNTSPGWQSYTGGYGSGVALYDCDNDGDRDLAAGRWWDRLRIYENVGGTFTSSPVWRANPSTVVEEIAWMDVDGTGAKPYADTFYCDGSRKLFYATRDPLYSIDSVLVDGVSAGNSQFCYDLISGWVSLGQAPEEMVVIHYKYSAGCDLAISNWDTYNMVFANIYWKVDMYAEPTSGFVPLEVQFSDSSLNATEWLWQFGDDGSSDLQNPVHTYFTGGPKTVSLSVQMPGDRVERTITNMVCVLADTMAAEQVHGQPGDPVTVTVRGRNHYPLNAIYIPVEFDGDLPLQFDGYSTEGCRCEYFDIQDYFHWDVVFGKRVTIRLRTAVDGSQEELPPGEGDIVKLHFTIRPEAGLDQATTIQLDGYSVLSSNYLPSFQGSIIDYGPATVSGLISTSCCLGMRGNADGDPYGEVTVSDILYLIDWTFTSGPQPACTEEANADGVGHIDIEDLVYLVDYVFKSGPPPADCF